MTSAMTSEYNSSTNMHLKVTPLNFQDAIKKAEKDRLLEGEAWSKERESDHT